MHQMVSQVACHLSLPPMVISLRLRQDRDLLEALLAVLASVGHRLLNRVTLSPVFQAAFILTGCV